MERLDNAPRGAASPHHSEVAAVVGEWQAIARDVAEAAVSASISANEVYRLRAEAALVRTNVGRLLDRHRAPERNGCPEPRGAPASTGGPARARGVQLVNVPELQEWAFREWKRRHGSLPRPYHVPPPADRPVWPWLVIVGALVLAVWL